MFTRFNRKILILVIVHWTTSEARSVEENESVGYGPVPISHNVTTCTFLIREVTWIHTSSNELDSTMKTLLAGYTTSRFCPPNLSADKCWLFMFAYTCSKQMLETKIPEINFLNTSIDPCMDFYEYSCGNFNNVHPLPDTQPLWDNVYIVQSDIEQKSRDILQTPRVLYESTAIRKAKDMYSSCMHTKFLDVIGVRPLVTLINELGGWPLISYSWNEGRALTWNDIGDIVSRFGISMIFNINVGVNLFNASETIINIESDTLSLPSQIYGPHDRGLDYFIQNSLKLDDEATPYMIFLNKVAGKLRHHFGTWAIPDHSIQNELLAVNSLMINISKKSDTNTMTRNEIENIKSIKKLQQWTFENLGKDFNLDWLTYITNLFKYSGATITENTKVMVFDLQRVLNVLKVIQNAKPRDVTNFVLARIITYMSPETDKYMRDTAIDLYESLGAIYAGYPRWKYCTRKVLDYPNIGMSLAVSHEYQKSFVNPSTLDKVAEMVNDLRKSFNALLNENDWMDDQTKQLAVIKADQMLILLGSAEYVKNKTLLNEHFKNLHICRYDHFGNMNRLRQFNLGLNLARIGQPRNRNEWTQSSLMVNGFYNGQHNRLTIPVAIMRPPFYSGFNHGILDYSRIGVLAGHEITHGFDNSGKSYNADGTVEQWWLGTTEEEYNKRVQCFIDQYSSHIIPELNLPVDGRKTVNENIADNGGLREAYRAFKALQLRHKRMAKKTLSSGFTDEQSFFIGYSTSWCRTSTLETMKRYYIIDDHAPNRFRVNVPVSNMPEFAEAFSCSAGSAMNPEDRCRIW